MICRWRASLAAVLLVLAGCANENIGREFPRCDFDDGITSEMILQAQAVPTARYGACLDDLPAGWSYVHQEAESGRARFWLDSDRLGDEFAAIILTDGCSPGPAVPILAPTGDIEAVAESSISVEPVRIRIVPVEPEQMDYAASVGVDLAGRHVRGRPLELSLDEHGPAAERIDEAVGEGQFVLSLSNVDQASGTVGLHVPGEEDVRRQSLEDALEDIEDEVAEPRYAGSWFFTFDGGCIEWRFDASGPEVAMLSSEIREAVGFVRLDLLRAGGESAGFLIGEQRAVP